MRLTTTILLGTLAALTISCSGKNGSVEDDWPGIDELQLDKTTEDSQGLAFVGPLTLKSKLAIPSMGKNVSFNLTTSCQRILPVNSQKQSIYKKISSYKAGTFNNISELPTSEFLPDEVLIFPEFFKSCDISLTAYNDIGSTQTSELKDLSFEFSEESGRQLIANKQNSYRNLELPITFDDFKEMSFTHATGLSFINSKILCHTKDGVQVIDAGEEAKHSLAASYLRTIKYNDSAPTASCVVTATNNDGATITSERFQALDRYADKYFLEVVKSIPVKPHEQIFYQSSNHIQNTVVATFLAEASKSRSLQVKFKNISNQIFRTEVITGMKETSRVTKAGDDDYRYQMVKTTLPAQAYWSETKGSLQSDTFNIMPKKNSLFSLHLNPNFYCNNSSLKNTSAEIGFTVELRKNNPIFDIQVLDHNDFTTFVVEELNLLELVDDGVVSNMYPSARAEDIRAFDRANAHLFLKLMYRNNNIQPGVRLKSQFTTWSMNPQDDSATFLIQNRTPPKRYPFRVYNDRFAAQTTCESNL